MSVVSHIAAQFPVGFWGWRVLVLQMAQPPPDRYRAASGSAGCEGKDRV